MILVKPQNQKLITFKTKIMKKLITTMLWVIATLSLSQGQDCLTPVSPDYLSGKSKSQLNLKRNLSFTVKVFVHIINEDDGTSGVTESEVRAEMDRLEAYYAPHDICFSLVGIDNINDSEYGASPGDTISPAQSDQIIVDYPPIPDVVDVYILPENIFFRGTAFAIPNTYLLIYAGRFNTPHLAHEMGHCLGLYHTHETAFGAELVDGSNCNGAGDLLCDTPADPGLSGNVDDACVYTGTAMDGNGESYNPDVTNTMSYAPFSCRGLFTQDQEDRMHDILSSVFTVANDILVDDSALDICCDVVSSGVQVETSLDYITSSDFEVNSSAVVHFIAEDYITLSPDFVANPGSQGNFQAYINYYCDGNFPDVGSSFNAPAGSLRINASNHSIPEAEAFDLFPNPAYSKLNLTYNLAEEGPISIKITNQYGQVMQMVENQAAKAKGQYRQEIDLTNWTPGMYYAILQTSSEQFVKAFVVAGS